MKKLCFALALLSTNLLANNEFQLGAMIGEPVGISGKMSLQNNRSVDLGLAYSINNDYGFSLHSDYLVENVKTFTFGSGIPAGMYYGIGARLISIDGGIHKDEMAFGPRAPIGLQLRINNPNIEFFTEAALVLNLIPETDVGINVGIGARYRF